MESGRISLPPQTGSVAIRIINVHLGSVDQQKIDILLIPLETFDVEEGIFVIVYLNEIDIFPSTFHHIHDNYIYNKINIYIEGLPLSSEKDTQT